MAAAKQGEQDERRKRPDYALLSHVFHP